MVDRRRFPPLQSRPATMRCCPPIRRHDEGDLALDLCTISHPPILSVFAFRTGAPLTSTRMSAFLVPFFYCCASSYRSLLTRWGWCLISSSSSSSSHFTFVLGCTCLCGARTASQHIWGGSLGATGWGAFSFGERSGNGIMGVKAGRWGMRPWLFWKGDERINSAPWRFYRFWDEGIGLDWIGWLGWCRDITHPLSLTHSLTLSRPRARMSSHMSRAI